MGPRAYDGRVGSVAPRKFGALAEDIAMPWFWARVHDRTAQLGYLRGGFQRLYDRLAKVFRRPAASCALGTEVREIRSNRRRHACRNFGGAPMVGDGWCPRWPCASPAGLPPSYPRD
jgi:phytoene dehydrogenase-like protein